MRHKVIIDTDPGIDDAMALAFAFAHPDIEVLGITSVFGNVPLERATANALRIRDACGVGRVPVCAGSATALTGSTLPCPSWVHGTDGLGDAGIPETTSVADPRDAVDFIAQTLASDPGEVTLLPVGPLTNIARLIERHPEAVAQAKELVVMGGAAHVHGNVTPMAEFNVAGDPEAADIVFGAQWPVVMVGLDVTGKTVLTASNFDAITAGNPKLGFLGAAAKKYIGFYTEHVGLAGCCMHDVCAVAHVVAPDILTLVDARIQVECEGQSRGKTAVLPDNLAPSLQDWVRRPDWPEGASFPVGLGQWLGRPRQRFAADIDSARMVELFVDTLSASDGSRTG